MCVCVCGVFNFLEGGGDEKEPKRRYHYHFVSSFVTGEQDAQTLVDHIFVDIDNHQSDMIYHFYSFICLKHTHKHILSLLFML